MASEWSIDQPESFTVGDLSHGHIVMDPSGLHAYATDGVTVVFGVDTATGTVTIVAGPASVIPGATVSGAVASSTTATNLAGGGTASGTTTIAGQLIVGNPLAAHVVVGVDSHGADGVRLYASDGITPLIDLNIAGTPTITGALIRTAATGSRIEMSASALQTLKWFTGDPQEARNGYVASGVSPAFWAVGSGNDILSIIMQPPGWTSTNTVLATVEVHSGDRAANHGAWALISASDRTATRTPGVSVDGDQQVIDIGDSVGPRSAGFNAGALQVVTIVGIEQVNIAKSQGATIIAQFDGLSGSGKLHWNGATLNVPANVEIAGAVNAPMGTGHLEVKNFPGDLGSVGICLQQVGSQTAPVLNVLNASNTPRLAMTGDGSISLGSGGVNGETGILSLISRGSDPSRVSSSGALYCKNGGLYYKGTNDTVTLLANP